jgi:phage minor structural protein
MIQVYADNALVYDSRLEEYDLVGLRANTGLNIGGTASLVMPPDHPGYYLFTSYKTIVTIYRDGALRFRGRALYPTDDFLGQRTITCEGELCLLRDGIIRAYTYQDSPADIFASILTEYNSQVDSFKQFRIGTVTVTDPNDYVRLESLSAETALDTINKLVERCGGYIVFTTASDGVRVINWLASVSRGNNQTIEFGENLLNYSRTGANTDLVTRIYPYGAMFGSLRLTIEEINDGLEYIQDDVAVARYGVISRAVYWDDVEVRTNLLAKARAYLAEHQSIVTSLELSALDLSLMDKTLDSFAVGDLLRVVSAPHGIDDEFLLSQMTEDFLDPAQSSIVLGKDTETLTRADVASIAATRAGIVADYATGMQQVAADIEETTATQIAQSAEEITLEVSKTYTTNDQVTGIVSTSLTQLEDQFTFLFTELQTDTGATDAELRDQIELIRRYISFENGYIKLGSSDSAITLSVENDLIVFRKNGAQFGWWDGVDFHTGNIVVAVNERAQLGNFAFVPRTNGSLSFLKVGG